METHVEAPHLARLRRSLRSMTYARLFAAPWVAVVVLTEEAEQVPPWGRGPGLALAVILLVGGLMLEARGRRATSIAEARRVAIAGIVFDAGLCGAALWLYVAQPLSGIWAILYIIPLEAATFFALAGALMTWVGTTVMFALVQLGASAFQGALMSWNMFAFQTGIGLIITLISGMLARSLRHEREAVERELDERRKAERELAERHRQLTEAREIAKLAAWEWDRATRRITWSEGLCEIHGLDPSQEATPHDFAALRHPEDDARVRRVLEDAMYAGTPFVVDYRIVRPDGELRFLRAKGEVVLDEEGAPAGLFGTIQDTTAQREIELALQQANADLQRSVTELQERNLQTELTASMGEMLLSCVTPAEIDAVVADFGRRMFPGCAGALAVVDEGLLVEHVAWPERAEATVPVEPEACWALRLRKPHVVPADAHVQRCSHLAGVGYPTLCVPLLAQGEVVGVLTIGDDDVERLLEGPARRLAQAMAEYVGLALANLNLREELREQSVRDPLTGLFNRRYLVETLGRELQRAVRAGDPLSLLAIDVDRFKELNDTAGHAAGDEALRKLGAFLQSEIRAGDIACRTGGDEFTVVLTGTTVEQAASRAERIRTGCSSLVGAQGWDLTISVGVAGVPPHGSDAETLQRMADAALYRAKRGGRDQVAIADAEPAASSLRLAAGR